MAMIDVRGVSKFYRDFPAARDVSFSVPEGEIVGLLGLNGAGKSTILKMLGTFLLPSAGEAYVGGYSVERDADAVRRIIGFLPDSPPLYDEMTVRGYLRYVARLKDVAGRAVDARVDDAMAKTAVTDVADARLGELSHGYRQRVGIAQALVNQPRVLILDEPINGLDPVQIVEMRDLIVSLRGQHTVLLSSHILSEITRTCDRILIIDHGQLIAEGSEAELTAQVRDRMQVVCELAQPVDRLVAGLEDLRGVDAVRVDPAAHGGVRVTLDTQGDVRAEVAKTVVGLGGELLTLTREEAGLEAVFVGLVNEHGGRGA